MKNEHTLLLLLIIVLIPSTIFGQVHTDQNGIKTAVTDIVTANATQARRYTIAELGYNTHHWQKGGVMIVELFMDSYGTGYEKYIIELGYTQGTQGSSPVITLLESRGAYHYAKLSLGASSDMGTMSGGYSNHSIPVYLDIRYYGAYRAKITHLRSLVTSLTNRDQIVIHQTPSGSDIPDFTAPTVPSAGPISNLAVTGSGSHYISNGKLGIGTTTPDQKLTVAGTVKSKEIIVEANAGADFVFEEDYDLPTLAHIETFIKANKHLEGIASAKEMKANGVKVGELQIQLLQKIEELTLYTIAQNKYNKAQQKTLENQQELLNAQAKLIKAMQEELENIKKGKN